MCQIFVEAEDIVSSNSDNQELHNKVSAANVAAAAEKQAKLIVINSKNKVRALTRRIKAHPAYTEAMGNLLGVVGAEISTDLSLSKPVLRAADQTGGI